MKKQYLIGISNLQYSKKKIMNVFCIEKGELVEIYHEYFDFNTFVFLITNYIDKNAQIIMSYRKIGSSECQIEYRSILHIDYSKIENYEYISFNFTPTAIFINLLDELDNFRYAIKILTNDYEKINIIKRESRPLFYEKPLKKVDVITMQLNFNNKFKFYIELNYPKKLNFHVKKILKRYSDRFDSIIVNDKFSCRVRIFYRNFYDFRENDKIGFGMLYLINRKMTPINERISNTIKRRYKNAKKRIDLYD